MAFQLARVSSGRIPSVLAKRSYCAVSATLKDFGVEQVDAETRKRVYPKIGNRDIVGFGRTGMTDYLNEDMFPYPAIRFESNTPESEALMEKSLGDWKQLDVSEQKRLYRHSFQKTMVEIDAECAGEWRTLLSVTLTGVALSLWVLMWIKDQVMVGVMPRTMTKEWQLAREQRNVAMRTGIVTGLSSKWDYEKEEWKK